jgi:hypothetical protein
MLRRIFHWLPLCVALSISPALGQSPKPHLPSAVPDVIRQEVWKEVCRAPSKASNDPSSLTDLERVRLYLRCELKGGRDEYTSSSCCEHLTANAAALINVCSDRPENAHKWLTGLKATYKC